MNLSFQDYLLNPPIQGEQRVCLSCTGNEDVYSTVQIIENSFPHFVKSNKG